METVKTKKAYKGLPMEGPIADWYTKTTISDLNRHKHMAEQLMHHIPAGGNVLEIAPGPGFFCIELAKLGKFQITGIDISKSFVEIAQKNADTAGVNVTFRQGNASGLPFGKEVFDFTFCQAAFKNFSEPVEAIAEMYRVLRPGGKSVIADMRHDASLPDIEQELENMNLNPVNKWIVRWTFQNMLLKSAYSVQEMRYMVSQTPFRQCRIETQGIGFQVWLEK
jgi:ubiquinone/menaquinone biosynthesis C-methylase UbiE